jgi:hypothetical protein
MDLPLLVRLPQDVQGHAVLDAARHVQLFGLGVDRARRSAVAEMDSQQGVLPVSRRNARNFCAKNPAVCGFESNLDAPLETTDVALGRKTLPMLCSLPFAA